MPQTNNRNYDHHSPEKTLQPSLSHWGIQCHITCNYSSKSPVFIP
jgi:hypothetical protein